MDLLIGKKLGMTQVFSADNTLVPVTVIEAGPCPVVAVRTPETDGYHAIQIGFGQKKEKNTSKGEMGHAKKAGVAPARVLREIRLDAAATVKPGDQLTVSLFKDGEMVDVIGTTKGLGFQGVMKRYNFAGQPATHGHMMHRRTGSIGMRQTPGHTFRGKKMPGRHGVYRRTMQNLVVVQVLPEKNVILVKGSVPGANGSTVYVRKAIKSRAA